MATVHGVATAVDGLLAHLKLDGWCVVEDVIPVGLVNEIRDSVLATESSKAYAEYAEPGYKNFVAWDHSLAPYLADDRLLGVLEAMWGPGVRISSNRPVIRTPGLEAGFGWHADSPFNQNYAGRISPPFPDVAMHVTTLWMLSPMSPETGGTYVVPGSHRSPNNPTGDFEVRAGDAYPTAMQVTGSPGSVLMFDSRLWHSKPPNPSDRPRVAVRVTYAPWWLNLNVLSPDSAEAKILSESTGKGPTIQHKLPRDVYDGLPERVKPLFQHWVDG